MIISQKKRARSNWRKFLFYFFVILILGFFLFPIIWMLMASLKTQVQNFAIPPVIFFRPNFNNFQETFARTAFSKYIWNSFVVAAGSTILGLIVGVSAAFGIGRFKKNGVALAILTARIMPAISYLLPWYIFFLHLNLIGSFLSLILTHLTVGFPIITWMMISAFEEVPQELEDATLIDGGSVYSFFFIIALPLVAPAMAASAIIAFIFSWNNFLFSIVLAGSNTRPLPVAIFNFVAYMNINVGGMAAAAVVVTAPPMILALIAQRHIVSGLTMGAIKG